MKLPLGILKNQISQIFWIYFTNFFSLLKDTCGGALVFELTDIFCMIWTCESSNAWIIHNITWRFSTRRRVPLARLHSHIQYSLFCFSWKKIWLIHISFEKLWRLFIKKRQFGKAPNCLTYTIIRFSFFNECISPIFFPVLSKWKVKDGKRKKQKNVVFQRQIQWTTHYVPLVILSAMPEYFYVKAWETRKTTPPKMNLKMYWSKQEDILYSSTWIVY